MTRLQDAARDVLLSWDAGTIDVNPSALVSARVAAQADLKSLRAALAAEAAQPSREELVEALRAITHPMAGDDELADAIALLSRHDAAGGGK